MNGTLHFNRCDAAGGRLEIVRRFEAVVRIVGDEVHADQRELAEKHYAEHVGKDFSNLCWHTSRRRRLS